MKRRLVTTSCLSIVWLFVALFPAQSLEARSSASYGPSVLSFRYSPQLLQFGPDDRGVVHTGFASVGWQWMPATSSPTRGQRRLGSDLLTVNLASLSLVLPLHGAGWFPTFGGSLRGRSQRFAYHLNVDQPVYRRDFAMPSGRVVRTAAATEHP